MFVKKYEIALCSLTVIFSCVQMATKKKYTKILHLFAVIKDSVRDIPNNPEILAPLLML